MIAQLDSFYLRAGPGKLWQRLLAYALIEGRPLTTRGQWVNPAVIAGHRAAALLPLPAGEQPIFILGAGRSGTTLLGRILGLHRDLAFLNEPKALWHAALGDDDLIGTYSARPGRYRMGAEDATARACKRLGRSYALYGLMCGGKRVLDKYPELLFRVAFLRAAFPGARFLAITRDGWQHAASVAHWSAHHRDPRNAVDWWGADDRKWQLLCAGVLSGDPAFAALGPHLPGLTSQPDRAALEWIATMRELERLCRAGSDDLLWLSFEGLVADPQAACRLITAHCGLRDDPRMRAYADAVVRAPKRYRRPRLAPQIEALMAETVATVQHGGAMADR